MFSLLFLVTFSSLTNQWGQSKEPGGHYGVTNVRAAIAFSFLSVFIWVSLSLSVNCQSLLISSPGRLLSPGLQKVPAGVGGRHEVGSAGRGRHRRDCRGQLSEHWRIQQRRVQTRPGIPTDLNCPESRAAVEETLSELYPSHLLKYI